MTSCLRAIVQGRTYAADITVLGGDGIGPEVVAEGVKVLNAVAATYGHDFDFTHALRRHCHRSDRHRLPDETLAACQASDAVLLGAVGGPKWSDPARQCGPSKGCWPCEPDWACLRTCGR